MARGVGAAVATLVVLAPAQPGQAATGRAEILDFGYSPSEVLVAPGDQVVWSNNGATMHSVVADDAADGPASGKIAPGRSYVHTFPRLGTVVYHCDIHPMMTGVVRVVDPASTTTSTPPSRPSPPFPAPAVSAAAGAPPGSPSPASGRATASSPLAGSDAPARAAGAVYGSKPAPAAPPAVTPPPKEGSPALPLPGFALTPVAPPEAVAAPPPTPGPPATPADGTEWTAAPVGRVEDPLLGTVGKILLVAGAVLVLSGWRSRRRSD